MGSPAAQRGAIISVASGSSPAREAPRLRTPMTRAMDRRSQTLTVLAAIWLIGTGAWGHPDEERALEAVRQEIQALEQRLKRQTTQRDAGLAVLREAELKVAAASEELARHRAS